MRGGKLTTRKRYELEEKKVKIGAHWPCYVVLGHPSSVWKPRVKTGGGSGGERFSQGIYKRRRMIGSLTRIAQSDSPRKRSVPSVGGRECNARFAKGPGFGLWREDFGERTVEGGRKESFEQNKTKQKSGQIVCWSYKKGKLAEKRKIERLRATTLSMRLHLHCMPTTDTHAGELNARSHFFSSEILLKPCSESSSYPHCAYFSFFICLESVGKTRKREREKKKRVVSFALHTRARARQEGTGELA